MSMLSIAVLFLFFFQAEDGIRDLLRSRGLGDVYKRQRLHRRLDSAGWAVAAPSRPSLQLTQHPVEDECRIVRVRDLAVTAGERTLYAVDLTFATDDRIWVTGANGVGKSSLLRALCAQVPGMAYLDQLDEPFPAEVTAFDALRAAVPAYADETEATLAAYGLTAVDWTRPAARLSVGQARRLRLAILLHTPRRLVVLDEPTAHLDEDTADTESDDLAEARVGDCPNQDFEAGGSHLLDLDAIDTGVRSVAPGVRDDRRHDRPGD